MVRFGPVFGLVYGVVLGILSFFATGLGHGAYMPTAVSSAPAGLFGILAGLLGAPILWAAVGTLAVSRRNIAMLVVLVHYALAGWLVLHMGPGYHERWGVIHMLEWAPSLLALWAVCYLAGQVVVWRTLISKSA